MKTSAIQNQIHKNLALSFDHYYQTTEFTGLPGRTNFDEVIACRGQHELKLKHVAAYCAMTSIIIEQALDKRERECMLQKLVQDFNDNSYKTINALEESFQLLMDEIIRLN